MNTGLSHEQSELVKVRERISALREMKKDIEAEIGPSRARIKELQTKATALHKMSLHPNYNRKEYSRLSFEIGNLRSSLGPYYDEISRIDGEISVLRTQADTLSIKFMEYERENPDEAQALMLLRRFQKEIKLHITNGLKISTTLQDVMDEAGVLLGQKSLENLPSVKSKIRPIDRNLSKAIDYAMGK